MTECLPQLSCSLESVDTAMASHYVMIALFMQILDLDYFYI